MEKTVEVRLQVPTALHELVKELARQDLRTTHNEYLHLLGGLTERYRTAPYRVSETEIDPN